MFCESVLAVSGGPSAGMGPNDGAAGSSAGDTKQKPQN